LTMAVVVASAAPESATKSAATVSTEITVRFMSCPFRSVAPASPGAF